MDMSLIIAPRPHLTTLQITATMRDLITQGQWLHQANFTCMQTQDHGQHSKVQNFDQILIIVSAGPDTEHAFIMNHVHLNPRMVRFHGHLVPTARPDPCPKDLWPSLHDMHMQKKPVAKHHVFSAAFFSLSDIRSGASLFVLNLPLPSAAVSTFFLTIWTTSSSSRL